MTDRRDDANAEALQFGFLPINQANTPPENKPRRAYLSCERCRKRKTRCEALPGLSKICKRCSADNQPCEFRASRSTKRKLSSPTSSAELNTCQGHSGEESGVQASTSPVGRSTPNHPPNEQDRTTNIFNSKELETQSAASTLSTRNRLVSTHIHNTSDALDLLTFAATKNHVFNDTSASPGCNSHISSAVPTSISDQSPDARIAWNGCLLIKRGILSKQEVIEYLDFFFDILWPLKPVVPAYYRNKNNYAQLVVREPLLLICLVTLSSRYFPLSGSHGEIRSERIHWQAWKILQRFLQSVMWGSMMTRSLGAISSMLLLIDWHIKAINNPIDFTEGDSEAISFTEEQISGSTGPLNDTESLTGQQRYGTTSLMEKLNIVAPAYRSNKMSWILLSNAIALAHEACCFENEISSSAPISSPDALKQEWNRLLCVFIYLADESLATRLGLEPLLPERSRQIVKDQFSTTFAHALPNSTLFEGYFELSIEARKGRDFLHSMKKPGSSLSDLNLIPHLQHLQRALSRWERQYNHRDQENSLLSASLDIEFHYITIYCFAPAAQALKLSTDSVSHESLQALSDFAAQATQASYALLSIIMDVLEPSKLIKYLPVRCWLFIVAASLHLLQATLSKSQDATQGNQNIHLLRSVIEAIRNNSPDDSHMAIRFSKFLEIMVQVAVPASSTTATTSEGEESGEQANNLVHEFDDMGETAYVSGLEDMGIGAWDIPLHLEVVSDPLMWWESMSGRNTFARFP